MASDDDCSAALHLILEARQVRLRLEGSHFGHRRLPTSLLLVKRAGRSSMPYPFKSPSLAVPPYRMLQFGG